MPVPGAGRFSTFFPRRSRPAACLACPKCGHRKLTRQISGFALTRGLKEPAAADSDAGPAGPPMPDTDDPRMMRAMAEMERDMEHLDENNPRHMARMMKKMKDLMPAGSVPKEFDVAIKRLEAGEDPEKIEEDMGDVLGGLMGGEEDSAGGAGGGYSHDAGLYDM